MVKDYLLEFETEGAKDTESKKIKKARIPILMYHNIDEWGWYDSALARRFKIPAAALETHLEYISENYQVISMQDIYDYLTNGIELPENPIVLTFDDGWKGVYDYAYPILERYNLPFTIYLIASHYEQKDGYLSKEQIQEMLDSGLAELGNHTMHHPMLGNFFDKEMIKKEIKDAQNQMQKDFGVRPKTFSYPGGSYNKIVLETLEEMGFKTAVTVNAGAQQSSNELLLLKRIGVDGADTVEMLEKKLEIK